MHRTPPRGDVKLPSAKLSAVTKKRNEVEELLSNQTLDLELIRKLYTEYLVKVDNLLESCDSQELGEWVHPHKKRIDSFRDRIEGLFASHREVDCASRTEARSSRSVRSHHTSASSTSSARIRLAEKKAKTIADKQLLEKAKALECEELALKREQARLQDFKRRVEVERAEIENQVLEAELDKIERSSSSYDRRSSVHSIYDVGGATHGVAARDSEVVLPNAQSDSLLHVLTRQNEISSNLIINQQQSFLPKRELQSFDGSDATEFNVFLRKFDKMIETRCSDPADRLSYLEQFTAGEAQKLVKSCINDDPDIAYRQARTLLKEEFGNEFKIAHEYLERLNKWPQIKGEDVGALQDLSIYLLRCQSYLESASPSNPLNSPVEIMNIIQKLPYKTREQWRRKAYQKQKNAQNVHFGDLVNFIREEVALLKQPLFGQITDPRTTTKDKGNKTKVNATMLHDAKISVHCDYCEGANHSLEQCSSFKSRSFKEKSEFVKKHNLCFGCLRRGHTSKFCKNRRSCALCRGRHPTIMHDPTLRMVERVPLSAEPGSGSEAKSDIPSELDVSGESDRSSTSARASFVGGAGGIKGRVMCPIIAAKIRIRNGQFITVNVALDSHSSDSWIRDDLIEQLGAGTRPTKVFLSTMENVKKELTTAILTHLEISPLDDSKLTSIPILFTKPSESWPFSRDDIPTYKDVENLPYLEDVPFDFVTVDVGVLIGMNSPGLIKTYSTVSGEWEQPFASLHWLGWAFNGPIAGRQQGARCKRSWLNIQNLEADIERFFSHDYFEPDDQPTTSVEDERWLNKVKTSLRRTSNGNYEIALPFYDDNVSFPLNRRQVEARFASLLRKFRKDERFANDYTTFMNGLLEKGYIEKVPEDDIVVLDEYRLKVHVFGARSSPSVANFALRQAAVDFSTDPRTKSAIFNNFYVDDVLKSVEGVQEAATLYRNIGRVLSQGGFKLTGFCANSKELVHLVLGVGESSVVGPVHEITGHAPNSKTLGLAWNTQGDVLMYNFDRLGRGATRRDVLSIVASIYDPLGVASPTIVRGRKIFQECCRLKLAWDDVLPPILHNAWVKWLDGIKELNLIKIPRCIRTPRITTGEAESVELHVFCDGSEMAYGAVAYARFVSSREVEHSHEGLSWERGDSSSREVAALTWELAMAAK
ncbi:uncharacterized protein LOC125178730 [Hyalella azteca]|uniref:Uncharacterized protein LOC125178730 n=1 Tax=Hyalella azteca TaxID=294128 RepID=A0A979FRW4_HYAAZ|nr:uncharacterized protein LOC125178730 [Hyalella azteca]